MLKTMMKEGKLLIGLGTIALSLLFLYDSRELEFGSLTDIGPAFFPRVVSIAGVLVGLLAVSESLLERKRRQSEKPAIEVAPPAATDAIAPTTTDVSASNIAAPHDVDAILDDPEATRAMSKEQFRRLALVFVSLFAYCVLLATAGFIVANLTVTFFLIVLMRKGRYLSALLTSGVSTLALWLIFELLLQMPLPQGLFSA